jgi:hypothetical protein
LALSENGEDAVLNSRIWVSSRDHEPDETHAQVSKIVSGGAAQGLCEPQPADEAVPNSRQLEPPKIHNDNQRFCCERAGAADSGSCPRWLETAGVAVDKTGLDRIFGVELALSLA